MALCQDCTVSVICGALTKGCPWLSINSFFSFFWPYINVYICFWKIRKLHYSVSVNKKNRCGKIFVLGVHRTNIVFFVLFSAVCRFETMPKVKIFVLNPARAAFCEVAALCRLAFVSRRYRCRRRSCCCRSSVTVNHAWPGEDKVCRLCWSVIGFCFCTRTRPCTYFFLLLVPKDENITLPPGGVVLCIHR